jgi:hypothetical protein
MVIPFATSFQRDKGPEEKRHEWLVYRPEEV